MLPACLAAFREGGLQEEGELASPLLLPHGIPTIQAPFPHVLSALHRTASQPRRKARPALACHKPTPVFACACALTLRMLCLPCRSTAAQRDYSSPNVLLEVRGKGRHVELKSMAINRVRPHQLAVGAGDQYVRIYDRRMMAPGGHGGLWEWWVCQVGTLGGGLVVAPAGHWGEVESWQLWG